AGGQRTEGGEGLGDHCWVVPEGGSQHRSTQPDGRGPLPRRCQPRQREGCVPTVVPPRLEVIADGHALHSAGFGGDGKLYQLPGSELLGRGLIAQSQLRHEVLPLPWRTALARVPIYRLPPRLSGCDGVARLGGVPSPWWRESWSRSTTLPR